MSHCNVPGCTKPALTRAMCAAHYTRWRRKGDPGSAAIQLRRPRGVCNVDGCDKPMRSGGCGLCNMHYIRLWRHGDVTVQLVPSGSWGPEGLGDDVSYFGMHKRLTATRGAAAEHACVTCGEPAAHWAYDHGAVDPLRKIGSRGLVYSTDPDRYQPMCVPCHRALDKQHRSAS